jgi:hypothetical protein
MVPIMIVADAPTAGPGRGSRGTQAAQPAVAAPNRMTWTAGRQATARAAHALTGPPPDIWHHRPEPREALQRREQMKKYSTASFGPTRGMFTFTCMLAAFSSVLAGWPPCQLYEVGKYLSMVKWQARLRRKSSNG